MTSTRPGRVDSSGQDLGVPGARPRDGPSVSFEPDPLISYLVRPDSDRSPCFALVLVAAWPPSASEADKHLEQQYNRFRETVSLCWDETDRPKASGTVKNKVGGTGALYLYPYEKLHITIATLISNNDYSKLQHGDSVDQSSQEEKIIEVWKKILKRASDSSKWPRKAPFQLQVESAQIGSRAGILLWKDLSGSVEAVRQCIREACIDEAKTFQDANLSPTTLSVPGIIHSTFLRFYQTPVSDGSDVQDKFQSMVLPKLHNFFPPNPPREVRVMRYVCERTPYMHIPNDDDHVFASYELT